jgi:hypothetical protein
MDSPLNIVRAENGINTTQIFVTEQSRSENTTPSEMLLQAAPCLLAVSTPSLVHEAYPRREKDAVHSRMPRLSPQLAILER